MSSILTPTFNGGEQYEQDLFEQIAMDINDKGYSIKPAAMPYDLTDCLYHHVQSLPGVNFKPAGIGRGEDHIKTEFVRTDKICWITSDTQAGQRWLDFSARLQVHLNRRLLLGLFSNQSLIANYQPGDYYRRHLDAFKGKTNRVLSVIVYLNPSWQQDDGGELVLYLNQKDRTGILVTPLMGTIVAFLSEEFPHEVLPTKKDRYSIALWYSVRDEPFGSPTTRLNTR